MALGADRAILVETPPADVEQGEGELEPLAVAKVLREVVRQEGLNMVLMGKQSIDGDNGQTGQMLAGLLGWGQATQACAIELAKEEGGERSQDGEGRWLIKREVDGGVETLGLRLPAVITADLRLNEPRYASLGNIMKAKRKTIEKKTLADYGVDGRRRLRTVRVEGESALFFLFSIFPLPYIQPLEPYQPNSAFFLVSYFSFKRNDGKKHHQEKIVPKKKKIKNQKTSSPPFPPSTTKQEAKKKKPITNITPAPLGGAYRKTEPPPRQGGGKVQNVDGMISKLKELGAI